MKRIQAFQPYKISKNSTRSTTEEDEDDSNMLIKRLFKVPKLLRPVFEHIPDVHTDGKTTFVTEKQVSESLRLYLSSISDEEKKQRQQPLEEQEEQEREESESNETKERVPSDSVILDEVLRSALFPSLHPGSMVKKKDLSLALIKKMVLHHQITREGVTQIRKGPFPVIKIEVVDRTRRKSNTFVRGFEEFLIFPEDAMARLKSHLATSCSLSRDYDSCITGTPVCVLPLSSPCFLSISD